MTAYHYDARQRSASYMAFFTLLLIGVGLMVGLYYVKTRAQNAKSQAEKLERELAKENGLIGVLNSEIAYLESPGRLSALAEQQLGLEPIKAEQIITADDIAARFKLVKKPEQAVSRNTVGVAADKALGAGGKP